MDPISERDVRTFCDNTILVLTRAPERASDWRAQLEEALAIAQEAGAVEHAAFFQALLTLLEGGEPQLPPDHPAAQGPYAADIARVQRAVQALSRQSSGAEETAPAATETLPAAAETLPAAAETLPAAAETLPAEQLDVIVRNTLGVLTVAKAQRDEWRAQLEQALADAQAQGEAWRPEAELFQALLALLAEEAPDRPAKHLLAANHPYAPTLERIRQALAPKAEAAQPKPERAARGLRENQLEAIISNTIAVLTSDPDQREAWRARMGEAHEQAVQAKLPLDADFFAALVELLSAGFRPPASPWPPGGAPRLPREHPYAEALARIEQGLAAAPSADQGPEGGPLRGYTIAMPGVVVDAVQAYAAAPDWRAARAVVEEHALALIRPEAEELLEGMAAQAQVVGRAQAAEHLAERLAVLRACKSAGIEATFRRLE